MTQGDLVMSMDQLLTKPRLGTCHKFYLHSFQLNTNSKCGFLNIQYVLPVYRVILDMPKNMPCSILCLVLFCLFPVIIIALLERMINDPVICFDFR